MKILGEALPKLDHNACAYDLDNLRGLKAKDVDDIEVEVTYDDVINVNDKNTFLLNNMKVIINKHQLPISLSLRVKPMKEEHVKCIRDGAIIAPSVSVNTEDESDFQIINLKAIKSWFKTKNIPTDQSKISRTTLGGHLNEDKMTRSIEA